MVIIKEFSAYPNQGKNIISVSDEINEVKANNTFYVMAKECMKAWSIIFPYDIFKTSE